MQYDILLLNTKELLADTNVGTIELQIGLKNYDPQCDKWNGQVPSICL